jgi:hypothetical protein
MMACSAVHGNRGARDCTDAAAVLAMQACLKAARYDQQLMTSQQPCYEASLAHQQQRPLVRLLTAARSWKLSV